MINGDPDQIISNLTADELRTKRSAAERLVELAIPGVGKRPAKGDVLIRQNLGLLARIASNKQEDSQVRSSIVRAVAMISEQRRIDPEVVPLFVQILLDEDDDEIVRSWVAMVLPDLASPNLAGPPLLTAASSKNVSVSTNAAGQLTRVDLDGDAVLDWAERAITAPTPAMRLAAVNAVARLGRQDKRSFDVLKQGSEDRDPLVRDRANKCLSR